MKAVERALRRLGFEQCEALPRWWTRGGASVSVREGRVLGVAPGWVGNAVLRGGGCTDERWVGYVVSEAKRAIKRAGEGG